jgi:hypothetical protein
MTSRERCIDAFDGSLCQLPMRDVYPAGSGVALETKIM